MQLTHRKSSSSSIRLPQRIIFRYIRNPSPDISTPSAPFLHSEAYSLTPDCLSSHCILPSQRSRMVDWILDLSLCFGLSSNTFFIATKLIDKYFALQTTSVNNSLLHIIGLVCLLIASKYEDVEPLSLLDVKQRIGKNKFSKEDLLITEQAILKKVGFIVNFVTREDFIETICAELAICEEVKATSIAFARMSMYFYEHLRYKESQVAYCCLIMAGRGLRRKDIVETVIAKSLAEKVLVNLEEFQADILKFQIMFPSLKSAFTPEINFKEIFKNVCIVHN